MTDIRRDCGRREPAVCEGGAPCPAALPTRLRELVPRPISRFAGVALFTCWLVLVRSHVVAVGAAVGARMPAFACFSASFALVGWLILALVARVSPIARRVELTVLAGALASIGGGMIALVDVGALDGGAFVPAVVLAGAAAGWISLAWQEYLATQGMRRALMGLALGTLAGVVLAACLASLPGAVVDVALGALPLASALALRPHRGARFYASGAGSRTSRQVCEDIVRDHSPLMLTSLALTAVAFGIVGAGSPDAAATALPFALLVTATAAVANVALALLAGPSLARVPYVALPLMAAGVVAGELGMPAAVGVALSSMGYFLMAYLMWVEMAQSAERKRLPAIGLFASLAAAEYVGVGIGQAVASWAPAGAVSALGTTSLVTLLAASLFLMAVRDRMEISQSVLDAPVRSDLEVRVLRLADRAGLTPRETDVLQLWAEGHNAAYVQTALGISRNTVKSHLNHIYQKVGVTSREELLARVMG